MTVLTSRWHGTARLMLALIALTLGSRLATAQTVHCGTGLTESEGICLGEVARSDSVQQFPIELRISGGAGSVSGITVVFKADSGTMLRDSVVTDASGVARAIWYRPRGVGPVGIAADVRTTSGSVLKYIRLQPRETRLRLITAQDATLQGFPGGSGRRLIVEIKKEVDGSAVPITNQAECERHRVAFLPEGTGARVTPDTAVGRVYNASPRGSSSSEKPGCFAGARLALGSEVGLHEIRTIGVPAVGHRVVENARFLPVNVRHVPQIIIGGVLSFHRDFDRLVTDTVRIYKVQRTLPSGETATFDSAVVARSTKSGGGGSTTAMIGFSTPIPGIGWPATLLNLTLGADPDDLRRSQFIGLSLLRSSGRVPHNFPVDLHVLAHIRQVNRLNDPAGCAAALTEAACESESRRYVGPAIALSFDAGAVISEAIKKLSN